MFSFVLGIGLYGLTYLYPLYLGADPRLRRADDRRDHVRVRRRDVRERADRRPADGQGRSAPHADVRLRHLRGRLLADDATLTKDWDFWELFVPQILRGVGLMFAMVPITNVALGTLAPERLKNASGLFNLTRNLGGAVGLALLNTLLNDRIDLHLARLHEAVNWGRGPAVETLANLTARFSSFGSDAQTMALKQMMLMARQQGTVMAFARRVPVLAVLFVAFGALAVVMRRPPRRRRRWHGPLNGLQPVITDVDVAATLCAPSASIGRTPILRAQYGYAKDADDIGPMGLRERPSMIRFGRVLAVVGAAACIGAGCDRGGRRGRRLAASAAAARALFRAGGDQTAPTRRADAAYQSPSRSAPGAGPPPGGCFNRRAACSAAACWAGSRPASSARACSACCSGTASSAASAASLDARPAVAGRPCRDRGAADLGLVAAAHSSRPSRRPGCSGAATDRCATASAASLAAVAVPVRRASSAPSDAVGITPADYDAFEHLLGETQAAYSNEDLNALRARVTPEMVSYFAEDLAANTSRGVVNRISDVKLLQGDLAEAWREGDTDYATVAMQFSLIDQMLDRATGRVVEGDDQPEVATEVWTFRRERGGNWLLSAIQQA